MSASDDDFDGDDDQLKQLRSVWVTMRESDDEPPDRGLDALMAAARTKAAEMAPPPSEGFWTKVLAVFRRPPVLALASITVLLGGALFIAQRRDTMQAETSPQVAPAPAGSAPVVEREQPARGSAAPAIVPDQPAAVEKPRVEPARRERLSTPRPTSVTQEWKRDEAVEGGDGAAVTGGAPPRDENPVEPEPDRDVTTRGPVAKVPSAPSPSPTATNEALVLDAASASAEDRRDDQRVTQLVKQCESAAARSDCPAVRALAKRIQAADAGAYKQRVIGNATIARCLAE